MVQTSLRDAKAPAPQWLTIDEAAIRRNKGRAMSRGEIGCYASHFSIWQDMIMRGVRQAIILEDDTVVGGLLEHYRAVLGHHEQPVRAHA